MSKYVVRGGRPLAGKIKVHGAKNSILPVLAASLLNKTGEQIRLQKVPSLYDVRAMISILTGLGARVERDGEDLLLQTENVDCYHVPDALMREMRSSIFLMGPLLGRLGRARLCYPGGCAIGKRPINLHLDGLRALGAVIEEKDGYIEAQGRLRGGVVNLAYPSVGATENLILAAATAPGETIIRNAACEPEIVDLQKFLNILGAEVKGAGTPEIRIKGVPSLHGGSFSVFPDRIVAGTYLLAGAITGGCVTVEEVIPEHLEALLRLLDRAGASVKVEGSSVTVSAGRLKALPRVETNPYPGFPTDLQPPLVACLTLANGSSTVIEHVFKGRFHHVAELRKMGARITVHGNRAVISGVPALKGAVVTATDLRAGAALVLAALAARGESQILGVRHIERGYERLPEALRSLGARIYRVEGMEKEAIP
ncbi:MAG: UDP-N-acetylglucosamine 1-carboxyvinyltransferase [Firmicutes bacterium]|nr:UDP-N-acetylglucosamine 1-carboxyvinyltransferase [Bacillota bacterium]HPU01352.1 UDP-N-acetylglucosamine 1-carboxyvinyltransferase [Bacillota bacterium]